MSMIFVITTIQSSEPPPLSRQATVTTSFPGLEGARTAGPRFTGKVAADY